MHNTLEEYHPKFSELSQEDQQKHYLLIHASYQTTHIKKHYVKISFAMFQLHFQF
jgi:hypothetical protein